MSKRGSRFTQIRAGSSTQATRTPTASGSKKAPDPADTGRTHPDLNTRETEIELTNPGYPTLIDNPPPGSKIYLTDSETCRLPEKLTDDPLLHLPGYYPEEFHERGVALRFCPSVGGNGIEPTTFLLVLSHQMSKPMSGGGLTSIWRTKRTNKATDEIHLAKLYTTDPTRVAGRSWRSILGNPAMCKDFKSTFGQDTTFEQDTIVSGSFEGEIYPLVQHGILQLSAESDLAKPTRLRVIWIPDPDQPRDGLNGTPQAEGDD